MDNNILEETTFRKLNKNDKELFCKLRMAFLSNSLKNSNETEKRQIEHNIGSYFDNHIHKGDFIGMIGEYRGNTVSTAYLIITERPAHPKFMNGKTGTLLNVYTYPEYRKRGIARKLIEEIIKEVKSMGIGFIDLKATEAGYNLYKEMGFINDKDTAMCLNI